jgi:hypothetical protein
LERNYKIGDKVLPVNKTPRIRDKDNCATYYEQIERNQPFLYVVGVDEEETVRLQTPCYWCNVDPVMGGDSFSEKDLRPYQKSQVEKVS